MHVFETRKTFAKTKLNVIHRAATVLSHNKFGQITNIATIGVSVAMQIVFGAVYEAYNVGILFDGAGLSKVAQLGGACRPCGFQRYG